MEETRIEKIKLGVYYPKAVCKHNTRIYLGSKGPLYFWLFSQKWQPCCHLWTLQRTLRIATLKDVYTWECLRGNPVDQSFWTIEISIITMFSHWHSSPPQIRKITKLSKLRRKVTNERNTSMYLSPRSLVILNVNVKINYKLANFKPDSLGQINSYSFPLKFGWNFWQISS